MYPYLNGVKGKHSFLYNWQVISTGYYFYTSGMPVLPTIEKFNDI